MLALPPCATVAMLGSPTEQTRYTDTARGQGIGGISLYDEYISIVLPLPSEDKKKKKSFEENKKNQCGKDSNPRFDASRGTQACLKVLRENYTSCAIDLYTPKINMMGIVPCILFRQLLL